MTRKANTSITNKFTREKKSNVTNYILHPFSIELQNNCFQNCLIIAKYYKTCYATKYNFEDKMFKFFVLNDKPCRNHPYKSIRKDHWKFVIHKGSAMLLKSVSLTIRSINKKIIGYVLSYINIVASNGEHSVLVHFSKMWPLRGRS